MFRAALVLLIIPSCVLAQAPAKKLIATGWDWPTPERLKGQLAETEAAPVQGLVVCFAGGGVYHTFAFTPDVWEPEPIEAILADLKACSFDRELERKPRSPAERPQDRYSLSDKRLFQAMDEAHQISVTLLEGEVIRGKISWFGRWEFAIEVKGGAEIVVFRHALAGFARLDAPPRR